METVLLNNEPIPVLPYHLVVKGLQYTADSQACFTQIYKRYEALLQRRYQAFRQDLALANPALEGEIIEHLAQLGHAPDYMPAVVFHPEQLFRLRYHRPEMATTTGEFLLQGLALELAMQQGHFDIKRWGTHLWATNGEVLAQYNEATQEYSAYEAHKIWGQVPVDFFSPYAQSLSAFDVIGEESATAANYDIAKGRELMAQFQECANALDPNGAIAHLVKQFTNVVVIKPCTIAGKPDNLFSATNEDYTGRTVIFNTQVLEEPAELMEVLVHEAVHNMLFMLEDETDWMPTMEYSQQVKPFTSPWSGKHLPLRRYMHALTVWYSLFNYYSFCLSHNLYPQGKPFITARLERIRTGYSKIDLRAMAKEAGAHDLHESLFETVEAMKAHILNA